MRRYLVGIDDTDFGESIGTGALARELMLFLEARLGCRSLGITRHQLLVHPDVPYTSHNSAACLALEVSCAEEMVRGAATEFVRFLFHEGADPGLCVAAPERFTDGALRFARRAQAVVVTQAEARTAAQGAGVRLDALGGTGDGIIGALSACALRVSGEDGRFISLRGIREVDGTALVAELLERTGVERVVDGNGRVLGAGERVETRGWIRPELVGGAVTLEVAAAADGWVVAGRKEREKSYEK